MKANGKFRADEKAVSPVIGVILMVAITVILAAIIAAFVFGMAPPSMAPQASIRGTVVQDADGVNYIRLEHQGGDTLTVDSAHVNILVGGASVTNKAISTQQFSTGQYAYIWENETVKNFNTTAPIDLDVVKPLPGTGDLVNVKIVDVESQQLIADITVRG